MTNVQQYIEQKMTSTFFDFGTMNVVYGNNNSFMGQRNIIIGDGQKVYGDYNVVIGSSTTQPTFNNNEERSRMVVIHQEMLKVYKALDESGVAPKGFYEKAETAILIICSLIEGSKTVEEPPKIDEPTTMRKSEGTEESEGPKIEEVK